MRPRLKLPPLRGLELLAGAATALAYLVLAWWIGSAMLVGRVQGNDFGNALTIGAWLQDHFPDRPFWFPYQGGGVSFTAGYAFWPIWWAAGLATAVDIDLSQALRLLAFLAVPIGGAGCYALARWLGVPAIGAVLAGLLYVLGPGNWNVFYLLGFFSSAIAQGLAPWAFLAAVAYVRYDHTRLDRRGGLLFAAASLLAAVSFLAHPVVGLGAVGGAAVAPLLWGPTARELGRLFAWGLTWVLLALGWGVAFASYSSAANREGLTTLSPASAPSIPPEVVLGLVERGTVTDLFAVFTLAPAVWVLGIAGALVALRRRAPRGVGLAALLAVALLLLAPLRDALYLALPSLSPLFSQRAPYALASALLPALATFPLTLIGDLHARGRLWRALALPLVVALLASIVVGEGPGYGVWTDRERRSVASELLAGPPQPPRVDPARPSDRLSDDPALLLALTPPAGRIDFSPHLGELVLSSSELESRALSLYTYQLSLVHEAWGDAQRQLYLSPTLGVAEAPINEVAHWHGLNRTAFLHPPGEDVGPRYRAAGWTREHSASWELGRTLEVWTPTARSELAATRERGMVLYVGDPERRSYTTFFRLAEAGALPFTRGWPVESTGVIDDYSFEELRRFDAVVLDGYGYRDRQAAYERLEAYVRAGGALFIDTGWEFVSGDWEVAPPAPPVIPLEELRFQRIGQQPTFELRPSSGGPDLSGIVANELGDLRYGDAEWAVSTADAGRLRAWARPLLVAGGWPLIATGQLGSGRIVWSGMNLTNHILAKQSAAGRELLGRLLRWLIGEVDPPQELAPAALVDRGATLQIPERARWLLWREPAAFGIAVADDRAQPVYRVGPGYMAVPVRPTSTVQISHDYPVAAHLAGTLSALTLALLGLWTLGVLVTGGGADPGAGPQALVRWAAGRLRARLREPSEEA